MRRRAVSQSARPDAPAELTDRDAKVWYDQRRYRTWMHRNGYSLPPSERFGVPTHPANRRRAAALGWAREHEPDATLVELHDWSLC